MVLLVFVLSGNMSRYAKNSAPVSPAFAGNAASTTAPVDPAARYHRLICLVHLTGSGKHADPIRPEYVPSAAGATRNGILAWGFQLTDDKNMAIIHVAAANRHAFDAILADKRPEVRVFEVGKASRAIIEAEMKKHKKRFDLSKFEVRAQ
jgi:hypothetical protein